MKHVRIFAAINLSVTSVRKLAELQTALQKTQEPDLDVRWVPPANLHVTMKFFGNLSPDQVVAATDAVKTAATGLRPFAVTAKGLGVFPDATSPRVLWVGLADGATALNTLQTRLEDAAEALGFPRDPRPFRPHLTIGRVTSGAAGVDAWLEQHAATDCLISTVEELVLYESRLQRTGAEYVAHARHPLEIPIDTTDAPSAPEPNEEETT